eukprot:12487947-Ditylum_brightwellii.AAC.1
MHNNSQSNATAVKLMEFVDHDINLWDGLLWLTGGLLKRLKTTYSLMVWTFEADGTSYIAPEIMLPQNTVKLRRA